MRLDVIGSSPAWPNPGGACSGYLVDGELLLDCGPGVLAKLRERGAWPRVTAIAITHLHLDHWGDLVPWVWGSLFGPGKGTRPALWLPRGAHDELRPVLALLGGPDILDRAFDVSEYDGGTPFVAAGHEVTALPVVHYGMDAYGFRVRRDGRTLAYSGDSGPSPALARLADGADLFLCEATLERPELDGPERGHLAPEEAAAAGAGANRLLLTHRPDELALDDGFVRAHDGLAVDV